MCYHPIKISTIEFRGRHLFGHQVFLLAPRPANIKARRTRRVSVSNVVDRNKKTYFPFFKRERKSKNYTNPTMIPLFVLAIAFAALRLAGILGIATLNNTNLPLRMALASMFLLTASAHWGKRRADLVRMVPPSFPNPGLLVTLTGILELLGAAGLLIPQTARLAAASLFLLLLALFPANIHAAREKLTIDGKPVPSLLPRTIIQCIFLAALLLVATQTSAPW